MSSLKILVLAPWARRAGGAENILWTFLRHLDRSRIDPFVVFLEPGPFERELASREVRTAVIEAGQLRQPIRLARTARAIARLLRAERPDLVLDWSAKTHLYGSLGAALAGMADRTAWWQQGIPHGSWIDRLATLLPTRGIGCYSAVAAGAQRRTRPRRAVLVVAPGIEIPHVAERADIDSLRTALRIPRDRFVVGAVARMERGKRLDLVIEAVGRLAARGLDVHGLVVGGAAFGLSSEHEPALHAYVARLGLGERITFTGQVPDAVPYIQLMDILASASESESFGMVLIEALALGVPVVALDAGGPAEIIEDGVSGILVAEGGAEPLAAAIAGLVTDADARERLAEGGHRRFEDLFVAERAAERFSAALEALVDRRKP